MGKLFLACFNGIVHGILESGDRVYTCVQYGFLQEPHENQIKFIKHCFNECLEKHKNKYDIVFIVSEIEKSNLKEAIKKIIAENKERYSNDDWKYWEDDLLKMNYPIFDKFNKEVLELMAWN